MSNTSEGSSKRKRENKSIQEPEETRRSARQKDKNHIPILQRAMNLKSANFLECKSLNSTQNRRQANDQTTVVQPAPAVISQQIYQSGSHCFNSNYDQTTTGHIHNIYERRASRLNPSAPEFRLGLSNNYAHQNTLQSSQNQQPFMTDASQRVIHPIMAHSCNLTNESPQPSSNTPVDQKMQASLYYQMLSSQHDSSRRVDHPIMADSFDLTNEAPQRSSNGPIDQNMQASLYYQMLCSQRDASRRANQSRTTGFLHSNQAARPAQFVPSIGGLNSQMMSPDASRRVNQSQSPGLRRSISQASQQVQFVPGIAALNSQMMSSDSSQRVNHPVMADSCNLTNEALQSSSRLPIDQNIQASLHQLMLSSRCDSSQRVNHPIMADSCNLINEARQPSGSRPIDQNIPASLYYQMLSSQHGVPQHRQSPSYPVVDPASNAIQISQRYPNIGARSSQRNNHPDLEFAAPHLNKSVTFDPQMNYSLPRDVSSTKAVQYGLVNLVNPGAGPHSSKINSSNSGEVRRMQTQRRKQNVGRRKQNEEQFVEAGDDIRMEGGNGFVRGRSPSPPKPLGERCQLCKIDLAFMPRGAGDLALPFSAVLPCGHAYHDQCLRDLFADVEPPCVECLDSHKPHG